MLTAAATHTCSGGSSLDLVHEQQQQSKILPTSTAEEIISKQIEGIQKMIKVRDIPDEEVGIPINSAIKRHFESEIKVLREAPRDADKLRKLVKAKQRELEDAIKIEDAERLFPEIEMLKFVLFLICRNDR
jgi:hypothetical protein